MIKRIQRWLTLRQLEWIDWRLGRININGLRRRKRRLEDKLERLSR